MGTYPPVKFVTYSPLFFLTIMAKTLKNVFPGPSCLSIKSFFLKNASGFKISFVGLAQGKVSTKKAIERK